MMQIKLVQNIEVQMDERDRPQNGLHINWYRYLVLPVTSARWFVFRSTDMFALLHSKANWDPQMIIRNDKDLVLKIKMPSKG